MLAGVAGVDRVSQLYVAGWGRPAENYLTKKPLAENLQQNLLLPPSIGAGGFGLPSPLNVPGNSTGNGEGTPGYGNNDATFQSLYTRNRAGAAGGINASNPLFNNGVIAGTAINLLQEPATNRTNDIVRNIDPPGKEDSVPFSFEKDDAKYLTYDKRAAGFTTNGPNVNTQPHTIEPVVKDLPATGVGAEIDKEVVAIGNGQHFPFTFSTVNRKDDRLQVCFLQAIINSLSESYNPTWQAKHFFGRSEQVHTYTFTDRMIDMSFTIFANEMRQLQNVYERVLWLAQQCYPDFDNTGRMSQGPLVALRVGDLFQYKTGIIRSLSYDWFGVGGGKWEMTAGSRMPQGCTVTLSYQIIHDKMPSRSTNFYGGPAGGLMAATSRYRTIRGEGSAFDEFEDLTVEKAGFGQPFIDSGTNEFEDSYLGKVNDEQMEWDGPDGEGSVRELARIPMLDDDKKLTYAE